MLTLHDFQVATARATRGIRDDDDQASVNNISRIESYPEWWIEHKILGVTNNTKSVLKSDWHAKNGKLQRGYH